MTPQSYGATAYQRERIARDSEPKFNLAELVRDLQSHEQARGANREWLQAYSTLSGAGNIFAAHQPTLPVEALLNPRMTLDDIVLNRALTVSGGGASLAGGVLQPVTDALRPYSVAALAGAETVVATGQGDVDFPVEHEGAEVTWLAEEGVSQITPDQPELANAGATYHGLSVRVPVSRKLLMQANSGEWLRRALLRAAGRAMDTAILQGTGVLGQPLGLANTTGLVQLNVDGTNTAADLAAGIRAMREQGVGRFAWLAGAGAEEVLRSRAVGTGGDRMFLEGDAMLGIPAFATATAPAMSLFAGPWGDLRLVLWGDLTVSINPYSDFARGISSLRILVGFDYVAPHHGAFAHGTIS